MCKPKRKKRVKSLLLFKIYKNDFLFELLYPQFKQLYFVMFLVLEPLLNKNVKNPINKNNHQPMHNHQIKPLRFLDFISLVIWILSLPHLGHFISIPSFQ